MKITIDFENMKAENLNAFIRIQKIYAVDFFNCKNTEDLFDLYCEAEDLWWDNFPFEASIMGDNWWVTRRFNDLNKILNNLERR